MKKKLIYIPSLILLLLAVSISSCKKDYTDPSKVTPADAFSDPRSIATVAVGLQKLYSVSRASSLYNMVTANAFVTNEVIIRNPGNIAEAQLNLGGGNVDGTNTILAGLWASSNKIIYDASLVIAAAEQLPDKNIASGIIGYTTVFKALSLGNLSMFWEKVPASIGTNVTFIDRIDGYKKAIADIDKALNLIAANPISTTVNLYIPAGFDVMNTLKALKARYSLYVGDYANALASASSVDLTKKCTLNFESINVNPIFETATATNNVFQPKDSALGLGSFVPGGPSLDPDVTDKRVPFYTAIATTTPKFRINGFGATLTTAFPIYLPGEMTLIKAECLVRQSAQDLPGALVELTKVATKVPASDPFNLGSGISSIVITLDEPSLLTEIYRQRCIELYMSGLKLEDMRRFSRPLTERKRNFFPYPFRERDNNPNTPNDPPF
jgi:starch-binding outer membrane protein, SusD/RagB family